MSDITIHFPPEMVIAILMAEAARYAGLPTLIVACAILAIPRLRARRAWRWSAFGLIGAVAVCAVPLALYFGYEALKWVQLEMRTYRPDRPTTIDGILFPPGSTVVIDSGGPRVASFEIAPWSHGTVPVETMIAGLPLIGEFRLGDADGKRTVEDGTLARDTVIRDIPCGPGKVVRQPATTSCILARDFHFIGHDLAAGSVIEVYRSPLHEPVTLRRGTLSHAERLFDIDWPAGTRLTGNGDDAVERIAHYPGPQDTRFELCVPRGATVTFDGAELHGPVGVDLNGDRVLVWDFCPDWPDEVEQQGYVLVGGARFKEGVRESASAAWVWK